jgi:kynurenine formamidase
MKLKDLIEKYGDYEIREFDFEEAFEKLDKDENITAVCIDVLKKKPKSVWELEKCDHYLLETDTGEVLSCELRYVDTFKKSLAVGNVFLTQEDAEKDVERRKVEALLLKYGGRRWLKEDGDSFHLVWDNYDFEIYQAYGALPLGTIFFDTKAQIEKAIEEIGADRIKEALFEVR